MKHKPLTQFKQPVSVLVLIYTAQGNVLLLERADRPGYWQSVTGSKEGNEPLEATAWREVFEETGIAFGQLQNWQQVNHYEIYAHWRHRYAQGVTHNEEHVFSLLVRENCTVKTSAQEHLNFLWLDWRSAADKVFSPSNAEALRQLARYL